MNDETLDGAWKLVEFLPPEAAVKVHNRYWYAGYNMMGRFENADGLSKEMAIAFKPRRIYFKDKSKYMPHQGAQEKARRVRQMERLNAA